MRLSQADLDMLEQLQEKIVTIRQSQMYLEDCEKNYPDDREEISDVLHEISIKNLDLLTHMNHYIKQNTVESQDAVIVNKDGMGVPPVLVD